MKPEARTLGARSSSSTDSKYAIKAQQQEHPSVAFITESSKKFFNISCFEIPHPIRTQKHLSDPLKGSAAKRLNMMLRWFVRKDNRGVDFGIWSNQIHPNQLSIPLDVHSGNMARKLGLLNRKQDDAKAVQELDNILRQLDPLDPVKYDFALFGLGAMEKFK